jgi:hypothetical protein
MDVLSIASWYVLPKPDIGANGAMAAAIAVLDKKDLLELLILLDVFRLVTQRIIKQSFPMC